MENFNDFVLEVRKIASPKDFDKNNYILKDVSISLYEEYLSLLKRGVELIPATKTLYVLQKSSKDTNIPIQRLISLMGRLQV